ncbi:hypothetical protein DITRI_Ditri05aG0154000 [Diplodiscus trichospermus]
MERQRSFSFKSARFLVFSFTISPSFIFLIFLFTWVIKPHPSVHQETHFQFKKSFLDFGGHKPITVKSLSSFRSNDSAGAVKHSTVKDNPFVRPENASGSDKFSVSKEIQRQENDSEVLEYGNGETEDPETELEDAPGPAIEDTEVESKELTKEDEVIANSVDKLEIPSSEEHQEEKKTRVASVDKNEVQSNGKIEEKKSNSCDVTKGKWVYDESYPLYTNGSCPFIDEGFNCDSNGGRDRNYMKWKWQPQDCDLPRINYYREGNQVHPRLDVSTAFRKALMTWAAWVDRHINPGKTQVFFRNSAPSHFRGGEWNSGGHCMEATWPLKDTSGMRYPEKNKIVEEVILQMKTPVTLLNVTGLSAYRIDGHPSIYGKKPWNRNSNIQDCSHWCLPSVPDTWNEILYLHLQSKQRYKYQSKSRL